MTCLRIVLNFLYFFLMSNEGEKWMPFFIQPVRFHGNQENLFLAYFATFFSEKKAVSIPDALKSPCKKSK